MTDWLQPLSYFLTNELRLLFGLFLVARALPFQLGRKALLFTAAGGVVVTVLQIVSLSPVFFLAAELLVITGVAWYYDGKKIRAALFLTFFYEVGVGLWDFLLQAGLGILFGSESFVDPAFLESLAGIWLARLFMTGAFIVLVRRSHADISLLRPLSLVVLLELLGTVTLSQQTRLPLDENLVGTWTILSMVLVFAVLFYRARRQREMEQEIASLKQEQAEIVERNYQALRRTYADNAKLYHDLHNHMESIYQCLTQGDIQEAIQYCQDLRTPVRDISQTVWTGDKALDYLISSKMARAEQNQVETQVHIEYPRNTNIRSVDLTTIVGNLLDNALEAAETAPPSRRFLHLTVRRIHAMLIIKVENGYGKAPTTESGKLVTSKPDQVLHGWGLKSVQTAADRYDGILTTSYKDGVFQSVVTLSFQPVKVE